MKTSWQDLTTEATRVLVEAVREPLKVPLHRGFECSQGPLSVNVGRVSVVEGHEYVSRGRKGANKGLESAHRGRRCTQRGCESTALSQPLQHSHNR